MRFVAVALVLVVVALVLVGRFAPIDDEEDGDR